MTVRIRVLIAARTDRIQHEHTEIRESQMNIEETANRLQGQIDFIQMDQRNMSSRQDEQYDEIQREVRDTANRQETRIASVQNEQRITACNLDARISELQSGQQEIAEDQLEDQHRISALEGTSIYKLLILF